ncbi:hypothetical protein [Sulfuriroseicoccus oceanibius]|uniref:Uncharacterized protein n=1 Tax=Sulfuriroseicoccus oceanibius TaxID=2707525 RepID=A0A6B3L4R1_9BACT|nr:hypothetical protein [Sulfuriroseicoccus oceanibius]QQL43795.1 hypothetical protein G3M56_007765 [Sulfuriroseicoccus oceanibius]
MNFAFPSYPEQSNKRQLSESCAFSLWRAEETFRCDNPRCGWTIGEDDFLSDFDLFGALEVQWIDAADVVPGSRIFPNSGEFLLEKGANLDIFQVPAANASSMLGISKVPE